MTTINELTSQEQLALERQLQSSTRGCTTLEAAAQVYTDVLHQRCAGDIILSRLFVTAPYRELAAPQRSFVDALAAKTGITDRIGADTLVLTLAGTSAYVGTASFLVSINFCQTAVDREKVEAFMGLINRFKVSTVELAKQGNFFAK